MRLLVGRGSGEPDRTRVRWVRTHWPIDRRAAGAARNFALQPGGTSITVTAVMLSQAYTTMLLTHAALSAGFVSCKPVDEPIQRPNDAADAA